MFLSDPNTPQIVSDDTNIYMGFQESGAPILEVNSSLLTEYNLAH